MGPIATERNVWPCLEI